MRIGVFDSGVGGLSVLKKIKEKINFADVIYYGDSLHSPYGNKTIEQIQKYSLDIGQFLMDNMVDVIVIACNTATAAALDKMREKFTSIPIIGVVEPGAITAVKKTKNKKIGVISTPLTAKSGIYKKEIKKINPRIDVFLQGCEKLCPMIEEEWSSTEEETNILRSYIEELPKDIDTLILGCTHYPLIIEDIKNIFDGIIVDPAEETAMSTLFELNKIALRKGIIKRRQEMNIDYFVTGDLEKFKKIGEKFMGEKIKNIYQPLVNEYE